MSGYMIVTGACLGCGRLFASAVTGEREPICRDCMELINAERARRNLPPFEILPDAYEPEPCS